MDHHIYLSTYVTQARKEAGCSTHEEWLRSFFDSFARSVEGETQNSSKGNRNMVPQSFAKAFEHLLPPNTELKHEVALNNIVTIPDRSELAALVRRKKVDFVLNRGQKSLLVEFKSSLSFNDLSAAIVEMTLAKKFAPDLVRDGKLKTASLHLYPAASSNEALREMNSMLDSPLDAIWILCRKTSTAFEFDIDAINKLRKDVSEFLS